MCWINVYPVRSVTSGVFWMCCDECVMIEPSSLIQCETVSSGSVQSFLKVTCKDLFLTVKVCPLRSRTFIWLWRVVKFGFTGTSSNKLSLKWVLLGKLHVFHRDLVLTFAAVRISRGFLSWPSTLWETGSSTPSSLMGESAFGAGRHGSGPGFLSEFWGVWNSTVKIHFWGWRIYCKKNQEKCHFYKKVGYFEYFF